ncbi:PREDICTED: myb/SANT-like DNA-binding domain-containing protein 4 isoform X2 [Rhagoletis zephyria]|uniref:myb/SANT-like DNA-binding domain-containing protein 4 isoform X2 n=2 Tax=Rhagoletis TaxID=28609 RepID=UPI0008119B0E|nr:PREDICTED: myb/SANT-like DNA-binding domain-containing protein 4 isoform X2 [Rhagoletis zephyria]
MEIVENAALKKRQRSANFTQIEVGMLIELVGKYKHILENKKTDAVSNKEKEASWEKVSNLFNASSGTTSRTASTLKLKYEGMKKSLKKKVAINRQELYKTGGGAHSQIPYSSVENRILSMSSNIDGLENRHDSDGIEGSQSEHLITYEIDDTLMPADAAIECKEVEITTTTNNAATGQGDFEEVIEVQKWDNWSPQALKQPITPVLKKTSTKRKSEKSKFEQLTDARLELVKIQIEMANKELKQKEKEHELRIAYLMNEEQRKVELHNIQTQNSQCLPFFNNHNLD